VEERIRSHCERRKRNIRSELMVWRKSEVNRGEPKGKERKGKQRKKVQERFLRLAIPMFFLSFPRDPKGPLVLQIFFVHLGR